MNKYIFLICSTMIHAGPVSVPQGGTGLSVVLPFTIISANSSTSASSLYNVSNGASGQGVMSNGVSSFASWAYFTPGYQNSLYTFAGTTGTTTGSPQNSVVINTITPSPLNSTATHITSLGYNTLANLSGTLNSDITAIGVNVLPNAPAANNSFLDLTAIGYNACNSVTTGSNFGATACGNYSLSTTTTIPFQPSTALGHYTLQSAGATLSAACAVGYQALQSLVSNANCTAIGYQASKNTTGVSNTTVGYQAATANTTGNFNAILGALAATNGTNNRNSVIIGSNAGTGLTTGNNVVLVGYNAQPISSSDANRIIIGNTGAQASATAYFYGIFGATTAGGVQAYINSSAILGTTTSSMHTKENISDIDNDTLSKLALLEIKKFKYKNDKTHEIQYGLIAEDVEPIFPELIIYDQNNEIHSIRYDDFNTLLIKQVQEQDKKIQHLEYLIETIEKKLNDLG